MGFYARNAVVNHIPASGRPLLYRGPNRRQGGSAADACPYLV